MRHLFFTFFFSSFSLFAQEKLMIEYEFSTEIDLTEITNPKLKEAFKIANEEKTSYKLITTKEESSYRRVERLNNSQSLNGMKMIRFDEKNQYKNFKENKTLRFEDYNGKQFIVEGSLDHQPWVLQKEKSNYLGYEIKKAVFNNNDLLYEAWYAPILNFKNGPDNFSGLPGIILKLIIQDTKSDPKETIYYMAKSIKLNDKEKITKPTKGQLITENEYKKFTEEQYKKYLENQNNTFDKN